MDSMSIFSMAYASNAGKLACGFNVEGYQAFLQTRMLSMELHMTSASEAQDPPGLH